MSALSLTRNGSGGSPWGYATESDGVVVGECAYKSAPSDDRVEIAYHTYPGFERRGFATEMARELIDIARPTDPSVVVVAQTLLETNPSTKILVKLGFTCIGTVQHPEDGGVLEWRLP